MKKHIFLILAVIFSTAIVGYAQPQNDKSKLEQERKNLQAELKEVQAQYDKVKSQTKQSLGQLSILKRKIDLQEQYLSNINKEIKNIDDDIYLSNIEIYRLQRQVDTLKTQYAKTVVYAYKNRSNYDYLNFIFSAASFNDALKRIGYLKSYQTYREKQVNTILQTQDLIARRKKQQLGRKEEKNLALQNQTKQVKELEEQKKEKDVVVSGLKSQEKDLKRQIDIKKKRDRDLVSNINKIVQKEIADARKAAAERIAAEKKAAEKKAADEKKNNATTVVTTNPTTTAPTKPEVIVEKKETLPATTRPNVVFNSDAELKLSASFEGNRGRLPWPVDNGFVKIHFGAYAIEGTLLKGDNPGLTLGTSTGSTVKSVFDGEVVGVFNLGDGMAVTIKHGKYFTTYSNLTGVSVSKGSSVRTGQAIGKAGRDDEGGGGQIDFILMIEARNVNPEGWLRR
ncbi:MAG TPA: peptidoglycan DD-metalloendopeptidase family protein [Chitinophagaceae bacterium]|nr:peptidoglycan DD-metalloendopeptidase family protein [Chitinophagaceae bacterium]HMX77340.1 peptidoglycan DD-metalloendopeptidase family protein [Chitinophagaceae bacterium]HNA18514.1 peptidoglycan DD-metalloendopeptidase family protein [Chitinophagaceae bacterium]HND95577.1 peptidoglycan DD-metalloendopeptidase family protein [Chitinophagaceae bacterium]HNF46333.1 peptidoglycan DD-metalloendopeptidase family protein [Chitinophagaceae bacterium]